MHTLLKFAAVMVLFLDSPTPLAAEDIMIDMFENQPATRLLFLADTVMGGVLTGQVIFRSEGKIAYGKCRASRPSLHHAERTGWADFVENSLVFVRLCWLPR